MQAKTRFSLALLPLALAACGGNSEPIAAVPQSVAGATLCRVSTFTALPANAVVTSATRETAPTAHCRVRGKITTDNPGPNTINFSLALPDIFNGRYLYQAPAGSAGSILEPVATLLAQGYAQATGDQGTRPAFSLDTRWRDDPAQLLDYNHRGVHVTSQLTQQLAKAYYQAPRLVRYLTGCSAGGRSGRNNARIYGGEDYDGILSGAGPSNAANQIHWARIAQYLQRNPAAWIPPALMAKGQARIIAEYDGVDGVKDGIVQDERLVAFDPAILADAGFSKEQIAFIEFARAPWPYLTEAAPKTTGGLVAGLGFANLSEYTQWHMGTVPPPWSVGPTGVPLGFLVADTTLHALYGDSFDWVRNYDFGKLADFKRWTDGVGENANAAGFDFSRYAGANRKMLFYYGMGDAAVPFREGLIARQEMNLYTPDQDAWNRFFLVPGWGHCVNGGSGPDLAEVNERMLDALVAWVETGAAPAAVKPKRAATATLPARTFLLCPEPQIAVHQGGGADLNLAESWSCRLPAKPL